MGSQGTENGRCNFCGGSVGFGTTTFAVDYQDGVFVARNVPAQVCEQCGESWIADESAERLESLLQDARSACRQVLIVDLAP